LSERIILNASLYAIQVRETTIYACNDGDGIVIDSDDIRFIGNIIKI